MKIIEVVDRNDELREMDIAVSFGSTHKDQADVYIYYDYHHNIENNTKEVEYVKITDVQFYENKGNYFAVKNWAEKNITTDYIENLIN